MNRFRWIKKGPMLIALLGMISHGTSSAQGQEAKTLRDLEATPAQAQDPVLNLYEQANPANLAGWNWTIARLSNTADDMLGANLQPVGDTLRTQLDIPAGQGLVVEGLQGDGASALAGLQQNDILLSLADKPLGTTDDLIKQLKAAGDSPAPLKILRGGKPLAIQVRPIYRVTLGPVGEQKTEQYIGISVVGPNDATRAQLGLTDGKGMVVNEVEKGSPAEKAGVKKWDIVLQLDGKAIDSPEALQRQVQAARGQQATLEILRAGKPVTIFVVSATRKVEVPPNPEAAYRLLFLNRSSADLGRYAEVGQLGGVLDTGQPVPVTGQLLLQNRVQNGQPADANDLRQRLDHLEKELTAIRAALDKISETLKARNGNKRN